MIRIYVQGGINYSSSEEEQAHLKAINTRNKSFDNLNMAYLMQTAKLCKGTFRIGKHRGPNDMKKAWESHLCL